MPRDIQRMPVVPSLNGRPPCWVVSCQDCGFRHDAHADTAQQALSESSHDPGHRLIVEAIDYTTGYGPDRLGNHPLYGMGGS
jgi:hypothetical protein